MTTNCERTAAFRFLIAATAGLAVMLLAGMEFSHAAAIECTEEALHARIEELNQNCSGDKTVTFNCDVGTVIYLAGQIGDRERDSHCDNHPNDDWNTGVEGCGSCPPPYAPGATDPCTHPEYYSLAKRTITCDGVTIDGENKITFELDPRCDARVIAQGNPYDHPGIENNDQLFRADAADITFRNFTYRYFFEGIGIYRDAARITVDNITAVRGCDDLIGGIDTSVGGHVIKDSTFMHGSDKCVHIDGRDVTSTAYPDYDYQFINNTFESCQTPIFIQNGRHYFEGNTFTNPDDPYDCSGVYFGHYTKPSWNPVIYFKDNVVDNCGRNVSVRGQASFVSLGGNSYQNGQWVGVHVAENASAVFQCDTFSDNGGISSTQDVEGGIVIGHLVGECSGGSNAGANCLQADGTCDPGGGVCVLDYAQAGKVDLGGGALVVDGRTQGSVGKNSFLNNVAYNGGDVPSDVWNQVAGVTVGAQSNWWNTTEVSQVQQHTAGPLALEPLLDAPPTDCGGGSWHAWRTDTVDYRSGDAN